MNPHKKLTQMGFKKTVFHKPGYDKITWEFAAKTEKVVQVHTPKTLLITVTDMFSFYV